MRLTETDREVIRDIMTGYIAVAEENLTDGRAEMSVDEVIRAANNITRASVVLAKLEKAKDD